MKYNFLLIILFSISFPVEKMVSDSTHKDPGIAWKLGMLPGVGQFYNKKYIKSLAFITGESFAVVHFVKYRQKGNIRLRNTYAWWIFIFHIWGMLDSYVDAHLSTFPSNKLESNHSADSLKINK